MSDMRIGGLASGMDIDKIVTDLMRIEKKPLEKMEQDREWKTYQRDAYREVNKKFSELENLMLDMNLEKTYTSKETTSSNAGAVTATGRPTAGEGSYDIEVTQKATAAYNYSQNQITSAGFDPDADLNTQDDKFINGITIGEEFSITTYSEDDKGNTVETTETFKVDGQGSLNDLLKKISDSDLGVRAFYDKNADQVMMERTTTGNYNTDESKFLGAEIGFNGQSANFLANTLDIKNGTQVNGQWESNEKGGQDAKFIYNNGLEIQTHENEYTLNGIDFKFSGVGSATIDITNNSEDAVDKVMKFVEKYNDIIEHLNDKTQEKRYRDFRPLTEDQRKDMEEKEIELWEEKSKSGMLRGDSVLTNAMSTMRQNWYETINNGGQYSQASEIGISTTSNYLDGGKLEVDEAKLRQALTEDPLAVKRLLSGSDEDGQRGIVRKLDETIARATSQIEEKAGKPTSVSNNFTLGRQIESLNNEMDDFQNRLTEIEDRYWREFGAMEKAISKMNQQSAFLSQNFMNM